MLNPFQAQFLACKRIAFFGISRSEQKMGNSIFRSMRDHGFELYPIHTEMLEFEGLPCYSSLELIEPVVEGILVNVSPEKGLSILQQAKNLGIKNIWMQQGAESKEAIRYANENGICQVTGTCILLIM